MSSSWTFCPHCRTGFQIDAAKSSPDRCPACNKPMTGKVPAAPEHAWYYAKGKQKIGPLSLAQLHQLAAEGQLQPSDMVHQESTRTWAPAHSVQGLFAPVATTADPQQTGPHVPQETGPEIKASPSPDLPLTNLPGYEVLGKLGRGGMGVVYKARQVRLNRLVALKRILAGGQLDEEQSRFAREAEACAQLQHPNIVQIHEFGVHEGHPFFSLELVEGGSLAQKLAGRPMPPRDAARLVETLALAVQHAHQRNILHRDLKPANVLLTPDGTPKIADFGLAKRMDLDSGQTQSGAIVGTPSYMAPEQAAGEINRLGPATDEYALGAILYETLTGRPPFRAATVVETLDQVRHQEPIPPRRFEPSVPADLETICLKCLAKEPAQRYPSVQELADDLSRFLSDQPIRARPPGPIERIIKFTRRNRVLVGGVAAVITALLFGLIRTSLAQGRAETNAQKAAEEAAIAKKNLLDFYGEAARRASQRGQHLEAIDFYDKALEAGPTDPVPMRLNRARALLALNKPDQADREMQSILAQAEGSKHEGEILLFQGDMLLVADNDKAIQFIRKAREKGLPPAEDFYARAMLAENASDGVKLLEKTLELDRFHHRAHTMLALALMLLGRLDDADKQLTVAENLFPEDSGLHIAHAMLSARRGDLKTAQTLLDRAAQQLPEDQIKALRGGVEAIHLMRNWDTMSEEQWQTTRAQLIAKLMPLVSRFKPGTVSQGDPRNVNLVLRIPPFLTRGMEGLAKALPAVMTGQVSDATINQLALSIKDHPEGLLHHLLGTLLQDRKRWAEAEREFVKAADSPAMFPCRRAALYGAIQCAAKLAWPEKGQPNAEAERRALKNLHAFLQIGPPTSAEGPTLVHIAFNAREYDLARHLLTEWERETADLEALRMRVDLEMRAGAYALALQTADRWLERAPNDGRAKKARALAVEKLRELSKSL